MKTLRLTVDILIDDKTRMLANNSEICRAVETLVELQLAGFSGGTRPAVQVRVAPPAFTDHVNTCGGS